VKGILTIIAAKIEPMRECGAIPCTPFIPGHGHRTSPAALRLRGKSTVWLHGAKAVYNTWKQRERARLSSASAATPSRAIPLRYTLHRKHATIQQRTYGPPAELEPSNVLVAVDCIAFDVGRSTHGYLLLEAARYLRCNRQQWSFVSDGCAFSASE
jgi:hypothetical protein